MFNSGKIDPKIRRALQLILVIVLLMGGLLLALRFALFVLPFTLALIISQILEPLIRMLAKKLPVKRSIIAVVIGVLFFALIIFLLVLLVGRVWTEVRDFSTNWPNTLNKLATEAEIIVNKMSSRVKFFYPADAISVDGLINKLYQVLASNAQPLIRKTASIATVLPGAFLGIVMTIVATILMMSGRTQIITFLHKQFPQMWLHGIGGIRNDLFGALAGYIKAQLKIMVVVFVELFIGFTIVGNKYALLIALGTAALDALPIFGAGAVLIPSALWGFITGDYRVGIGCAIMYGCTIVLRQMLEPKVLGKEIGLHPLLTLFSMYIGFKMAGVIGLIFGPIFTLVFKNIFSAYLDGRTINEFIQGKPRTHPTEHEVMLED